MVYAVLLTGFMFKVVTLASSFPREVNWPGRGKENNAKITDIVVWAGKHLSSLIFVLSYSHTNASDRLIIDYFCQQSCQMASGGMDIITESKGAFANMSDEWFGELGLH